MCLENKNPDSRAASKLGRVMTPQKWPASPEAEQRMGAGRPRTESPIESHMARPRKLLRLDAPDKPPQSDAKPSTNDEYLTGTMTHTWTILSKPENSFASATNPHFISGADTALSVLQPDVPGKYVLQLSTKGHGTTYDDTINVWVLDKDAMMDEEEEESLKSQLDVYNGYVISRSFAAKESSDSDHA